MKKLAAFTADNYNWAVMDNRPNGGSADTLFLIAGVGVSLAFGAMVASLFALESTPSGFRFAASPSAFISFFVAAPLAWFYWRMVMRMAADKHPEQRKKKFFICSAGLLLVGVIGFLYPLKFIQPEKREEVFIGLALAVTVLSGVGVVMWRVRNFLEADLKKSEERESDE